MECNKEEALKAMRIAEKKLETSDFNGARKMAQTAHRLFPTLENITQLITVCEIHCSAQRKLFGSENDWYGILQIEHSADETAIKKQYRKLALLLHPDKNKFAGAEAAFKLVGEAHRLLSDLSKRKVYDMKYAAARRNIAPMPSHDQSNGYTTTNKPESGTANGYSSVPFSHFPPRNSYKPSPAQQAFWTCCPFCFMRYQYLKCYLNKMLCCQNCGRGFITHDLDNQAMPTSQQAHIPQKKPEPGLSKSAAQKKHGSDKKYEDRSAGVDQAFGDTYTATNDFTDTTGKKSKTRRRNVNEGQGVKPKSESEMSGKEKSRSDAATSVKQGASKSENKKRPRKSAKTTSNSSESSQEVKEDDVFEKDDGLSRENYQRRSSRNKNHVSYKKYLSDDEDNLQTSKKSRGSESQTNLNEKMKDVAADVVASKLDNSSVDNGDDVLNKDVRCKVSSPVTSDESGKSSEVDVDTEKEVQVLHCADPEFSDFDKHKRENCFAVNQVWAIYDNIDGMPRFYARIRKVFSPEFKLQITWFETKPVDKHETKWSDVELPIACGRYTVGDTEETVDLPMFSHLVHWPKRGSKRAYFKYPRKGETWALFKDWDISWSSEPEKHEDFEYEFVEILSDYVEDDGVSVAYMDKVKGFICLFQTTEEHMLKSFKIAPNQLYRFSHQIPSVRMNGKEKEGVPKESFELDPAALPPNFNEHVDLNIKSETDNSVASGRIDPSHNIESPEVEMEEVIVLENNEAARKSNLKCESPTIVRKSPRKLNANADDAQVNMPEHNGSEVASQNGVSMEESSVIHINGGTNTPKKNGNGVEKETEMRRRSSRDTSKKNAG